ncbi:hypothetical protein [Microbacterium sp. VKM Ac-2923]|uniref:hypothetical protein n=1 Tax=Microbacterium sp. VKM Ac-2923 TaxID=2929476 RepID=UPI001FB33BA2|nr:hypothetical protein [Microbacterium sp. VKM Ac-2923]MCJ1707949.1 hypothetical protein [Microbacterium sp. VKM Ac-2923]
MTPRAYIVGTFITPDGKTRATGTIIVEPHGPTFLPDTTPPLIVLPRPIRVELVDGAFPLLGLVPARYRVRFRLQGAAMPARDIELTAAHTEVNPLDLALATNAPRTA